MTNERRRWLALYVLCAGTLMIVIDATIVNVALPSIQEDLGFSQSSLLPSLMGLAMSGATPSDSGLASGLLNTSVQVGGAIGLAVLATLATERTGGLLAVVLAVTVLRPPRAHAAAQEAAPSRASVAYAEGA